MAIALNSGHSDITEKQEETSQAINDLTSGLAKASTESKDGMTQLTAKIGTTQAKLATSMDTVVDSLNHIREELGGNGVKLMDGLGGLTDVAAFLDSLTHNLKSLDTNSKEGMENLVTALQENSKSLVKSVDGVGVELHEVGDHMKDGQESIAAEIKAGHGVVASSIQETGSTLTDMEEIFKTQSDEIKAGLSSLVSKIDETGRDSTAKLGLLGEFLEKNQENIATLGNIVEAASTDSLGQLGTIATNLGTAAANLGSNGNSLDAIANKIEGNNGDLNFILKNMTTDVSASILNGLVTLQSQLKTTGADLQGSMDSGNDKLVGSLAELEKLKDSVVSGLGLLTSTTETAGLDTKTGLASIAENILASMSALETELVSSLMTGSTKMATAIDGTKTSLNTIKQSLDTQNSKLDTGLSLVATNVAKSGSDSKAGDFQTVFSSSGC